MHTPTTTLPCQNVIDVILKNELMENQQLLLSLKLNVKWSVNDLMPKYFQSADVTSKGLQPNKKRTEQHNMIV